MKKDFVTPVVQVIYTEPTDVIVTSVTSGFLGEQDIWNEIAQ